MLGDNEITLISRPGCARWRFGAAQVADMYAANSLRAEHDYDYSGIFATNPRDAPGQGASVGCAPQCGQRAAIRGAPNGGGARGRVHKGPGREPRLRLCQPRRLAVTRAPHRWRLFGVWIISLRHTRNSLKAAARAAACPHSRFVLLQYPLPSTAAAPRTHPYTHPRTYLPPMCPRYCSGVSGKHPHGRDAPQPGGDTRTGSAHGQRLQGDELPPAAGTEEERRGRGRGRGRREGQEGGGGEGGGRRGMGGVPFSAGAGEGEEESCL